MACFIFVNILENIAAACTGQKTRVGPLALCRTSLCGLRSCASVGPLFIIVLSGLFFFSKPQTSAFEKTGSNPSLFFFFLFQAGGQKGTMAGLLFCKPSCATCCIVFSIAGIIFLVPSFFTVLVEWTNKSHGLRCSNRLALALHSAQTCTSSPTAPWATCLLTRPQPGAPALLPLPSTPPISSCRSASSGSQSGTRDTGQLLTTEAPSLQRHTHTQSRALTDEE